MDHLTGWRATGAAMERTTDGGVTWQTADTGLPAINGFQFVDQQHAWAWHEATLQLARTMDGGGLLGPATRHRQRRVDRPAVRLPDPRLGALVRRSDPAHDRRRLALGGASARTQTSAFPLPRLGRVRDPTPVH